MDAIKLLKEQHDEVTELFEAYEDTKSKNEKQAIFQEIADNLAAHAEIEEKIFYPAAYAKSTKDLLFEAVEEHLAAKRIISDLLTMSPSDENFDAKVKVLKEQIEHHIREEEDDLFKQIRKELPKDEMETLGKKMKALFEKEMSGEPSHKVPSQTAEAAPLR